jgi:hypothetical protein
MGVCPRCYKGVSTVKTTLLFPLLHNCMHTMRKKFAYEFAVSDNLIVN